MPVHDDGNHRHFRAFGSPDTGVMDRLYWAESVGSTGPELLDPNQVKNLGKGRAVIHYAE
jgi:hypothetical protein